MKYDPVSRLKRSIDIFKSRGYVDHVEMVDIIRQTRLILEKGNVGKRYPTLKMYGDWIVHAELSKNPAGHSVLVSMDRALVDNWTDERGALAAGVRNALGLQQLRKELMELFGANDIDTILFDVRANWSEFVRALLLELCDRPIAFPDDVATKKSAAGRKQYEELVSYRASRGIDMLLSVKKLYVQEYVDNDMPAGIYWYLRLHEGGPEIHANLRGILAMEEPADAFRA